MPFNVALAEVARCFGSEVCTVASFVPPSVTGTGIMTAASSGLYFTFVVGLVFGFNLASSWFYSLFWFSPLLW